MRLEVNKLDSNWRWDDQTCTVDGSGIWRRTLIAETGLQMRWKVIKPMSNWCWNDQFNIRITQVPCAAAQRGSLCSHHPTSPPLPISTLLIHLPLHGSDMGIHIAWIGWESKDADEGTQSSGCQNTTHQLPEKGVTPRRAGFRGPSNSRKGKPDVGFPNRSSRTNWKRSSDWAT